MCQKFFVTVSTHAVLKRERECVYGWVEAYVCVLVGARAYVCVYLVRAGENERENKSVYVSVVMKMLYMYVRERGKL